MPQRPQWALLVSGLTHTPSHVNSVVAQSGATSRATSVASAASAHPRLSQRLSELGALREARLWHQVTDSIEGLLREPELR